MGWRDLLQTSGETLIAPWVGGSLRSYNREWFIEKLPEEHGWYKFSLDGRRAKVVELADPVPEILRYKVSGYLVGDRIISDSVRVDTDPSKIISYSERVYLIDYGLDRFIRISAGRICSDGALIYCSQEMPLGPEEEVMHHYQDRSDCVDDIIGVVPALDAAFRMESWQRREAERRRAELERIRVEEEARRIQEARRQELIEKLGDATTRREMARIDFGEAARAALAIGGATYLDHRKAYHRGEMVVRYRLNNRRLECVCDELTLNIIDAGICLTDHDTGFRGDKLFTLESLPSVIREAERTRQLVVLRHAD